MVAAIAILAGIVIVAINPARQLGKTRDAQRRSDVNTILSAVYQYSIDNNGNLPSADIPEVASNELSDLTACSNADAEICKAGVTGGNCTTVDLSALVSNYLVSIPSDPKVDANAAGSRYFIVKNPAGRLAVCAPDAEVGDDITIRQ